ncbi:MAG: HAMP domain-containing protein, partial [Bacilli bacterium]|nr:HAMP domain-containing protein [Bacilli bacterium]
MGETKPNKNRRTLGIKAKLLLAFGVAAIVPSLALGTTMTILTRSNVTEGIKDDISSNISLQAQALHARISAEDDTLSLIADSLGNNKKLVDNLLLLLDDDSSNDADAIDLVDEAINGKNNSTSDTTGSIIKTFNYAVTSDDNLEAARLYSKAVSYSMSKCLYPIYDSDAYLTNALSAVSENKGAVHWSYEDGSLYAYHSVCCFSDQSLPVVGMIRFQISLSNFLALFDNSYSGNGYILADSSGNIIGSRSVDNESIDDYALSMLSKGDGAYEGENSFGAVASNDVTGWKIVYYIDGKSVQSQFTQGTVLTLSITAAAFIVALIFAYFLGNGIANRILKMKNAADQVAIGNYDIEVDDRGNDEIGSLAEAFNLMSNEVKKTLQDMVITQDGISQTFAEILEAKSGQSGHHVKRVSEYVGILAEEIGFKEDEIH